MNLSSLTRLELLGPFLVRPEAWKAFFASHPQLTGFLIKQSPRFDIDCMASLAEHCTGLTELRLCQVGLLSDEFLEHVEGFKQLSWLDLSEPANSLSTEAVVNLLVAVSPRLTYLNLSKNELLSDDMLSDGLAPHARLLSSLVLDDLPELTDSGVGSFFSSASNPPLHHVSFARNHVLMDEALTGILTHSGEYLTNLNINSWKEVSQEALNEIGTRAPMLKTLDVGFCRMVDDFVVKAVVDGCPGIADIAVFGCNKLTENCPRKRGISIRGIEKSVV